MKTPKEILLEIVPKDCYWEDMDNLTNTPIHYVIEAMESYAKQKLQQHSVSGPALECVSAGELLAAAMAKTVSDGFKECQDVNGIMCKCEGDCELRTEQSVAPLEGFFRKKGQ